MYISPFFISAGATISVGIVSRIWISFRKDRAARKAMDTTLFPPESLNSVLTPATENEDQNVLAELRSTLSHLNRQAYAEEFWNLDKDLVRYYQQIPRGGRQTMDSVLVRLIESDDKWLQVVGAKTSASLKLASSLTPLQNAVIKHESDPRFKQELESCLKKLTPQPV